MLNHEINIRVRYGETDQMKYVYYGNYAQYFEMGRVEWLRELGMSYKKMEELGIMLPVVNMNVNYLKPAKYDDMLTLKTSLIKPPGLKIDFGYELYNEADEILTKATTTLVFIDMKKNRPVKAPDYILERVKGCF